MPQTTNASTVDTEAKIKELQNALRLFNELIGEQIETLKGKDK